MERRTDSGTGLVVGPLGREALTLAERLAGDPFLDLGWLQPLAEGRSEAWPPGRVAWTGWLAGEPVSFLLLDPGPDLRAELTIGVEQRVRRLGIGRSLLEHGIDHAVSAGWQELFVRVDETNAGALGLFRSLAFRGEGSSARGSRTLYRPLAGRGRPDGSAA